jgi:alkanesulfonate monooxygenase SsuD/methylene tetrahydromethanopterin reductase-like flavin-dependent oxidoreductase (luciferase family)
MKIGMNGTGLVQQTSIEVIQKDVDQAQREGFASYWLAEHPTGDPLGLMCRHWQWVAA